MKLSKYLKSGVGSVYASLAIIMCYCISCSPCPPQSRIGKFLFVDGMDVIHRDEFCKGLLHCNDEKGHPINYKQYIDTVQLSKDAFDGYCTECISQKDYETILEMLLHSSQRTAKEEAMAAANRERDNRIGRLYDAMARDGAEVGTQEEFRDYMLKSGDKGYKNRLKVYNAFKNAGADVGESYEEFRDWLFGNVKEDSFRTASPKSFFITLTEEDKISGGTTKAKLTVRRRNPKLKTNISFLAA